MGGLCRTRGTCRRVPTNQSHKSYGPYTPYITTPTGILRPMPDQGGPIGPYGGYRGLKAFEVASFIYDGTVAFCKRAISPRSRTTDQMVQAARSGKQNIAEGSTFAATSKKTEMKLIGVALASLEELLQDYEDYLRQNGLELWHKDHPKATHIRKLTYTPQKSYLTYKPYIEDKSLETAANTLICLINQATYLLRRLLKRLERDFLSDGGFTENLYKARKQRRHESG